MSGIDDYLKGIQPAQRKEFDRIRKFVREIVPETTEAVSYGIPTFYYKNKYLIYFGAFKSHMSLFPASDGMIGKLGDKVAKYRKGKGTLQYTEKELIPDDVVREIIKYRYEDILGK